MSLLKVFYIFTLFIFSSAVASQAAVSRDLIIQREMDCLNVHSEHNAGIVWNDVCDVSGESSEDRTQVINQEMNQAEENLKPQDVTPQQSITPQLMQRDMVSDEIPPEYRKVPKRPSIAVEIAPEISYIKYNEHSLDKETGAMYGLNAIFTFRPPAGDIMNNEVTNMYRLEGRFSYGTVNYDGGIINGDGSVTPESFKGINDYMFELRGLTGKDFNFDHESIRVTPYLGGGYRYLFDTSSENEPFGYNRRIQYLYLPVGVEELTRLNDGWSLGADVEYDFFLRGFVTSYFQTLGATDANNTQKSGFGLRGSVKLIKSWDRFDLIFEPFVRYWHINNSKPENTVEFLINGVPYGLYEPNNTSLEIGARLGVEF